MSRAKKSASVRKYARAYRPRVESLESRLNLAGNVAALVAGPNLYLFGDVLDNTLRIEGNGAGVFEVAAVGTSLNGVANGTLNLTGIANIFIDMSSGNDAVTFVTANLPGVLSFNGGAGHDDLLFGEFNNQDQFFGRISALMGAGDDQIEVNGEDNFTVQYSFIANNGEGNNTFDLDPDVSLNMGLVSVFGGSGSDFVDMGDNIVNIGSITVNSGHGDNVFFLDGDVTITGNIIVTGGNGPDEFNPGDTGFDFLNVGGSVTIAMGNGDNIVTFEQIDTFIQGVLTINMGSGNDEVDMDFNSFNALAVSLNLGGGDDDIFFNSDNNTVRSNLVINTGAGNDEVTLFALLVQGATAINLGNGDNDLFVDNSRFRGAVSLISGSGADDIFIENGNEDDGIVTRFDGPVAVSLGSGNDDVFLGFDADDFAIFANFVTVNGGLGNDFIFASGFDVFAINPVLISITIV